MSILDRFDKFCNDISEGLPAEIEARQKQYEYYRDKLLMFKRVEANENDYNKEYFEKYALLSLVYCYDYKLQSMKKHERPDWIDENRSIGLEVTRALSSTDGEINSIINRYFGKGYSPEEIINKANNELKYNKDIFKSANGLCYVEKNVNYSDVKQLIIDTINTKISKFNSHYDKFNENWLYVLLIVVF